MKRFLMTCLISSATHALTLDLLGDHPTALLLPRGQFEVSAHTWLVNDTVDVFDVRDIAPGTPDTAGDMDGLGFKLKLGLNHHLTFLFEAGQKDYDYGRSQLKVDSWSMALRAPIGPQNQKEPFFAVQLSHRENRGAGISKLFSTVNVGNASYTFTPPVEIKFGGVGDRETGLMLTGTRTIGDKLLGSVYYEYAKADIYNELSTTLPTPQIQNVLNVLSYDQSKDTFGWSLHYKIDEKQQLSMDYNYLLVHRSLDVSDPVDVNKILNGTYTYKIKPDQFATLSGKYMESGFIGDQSFLYNKLVASRSDRKYGYLGLGYHFKFDFSQ